ncbi:permease of the drug/metabolite transporter (DMT) superfamily [Candidatus Scalindua japonica]|uniref:Permease of the drug/metabolite transporter (DMT) superfamily n=1 Tax=Candidatus Scalindua japonica TaxID=1284222 RepID=A0A286U3L7_9BACT|nr:permease of the drug/metabolite transporter (DMT) superfamily [Candidatus Scalindua japonica]
MSLLSKADMAGSTSSMNLPTTDVLSLILKKMEIPVIMVMVTIVFVLFAKRLFFPIREKKNIFEIRRPRKEARVFV